MQHYLVLSRRNFYAEKQHSNEVLYHLALGGPVIMPHHVQHFSEDSQKIYVHTHVRKLGFCLTDPFSRVTPG